MNDVESMTTPDVIEWKTIRAELAKPFPEEDIRWFPGSGNQEYAYITARDVDDRLDDVVGPGNWSVTFRIVDLAKEVVECQLRVFGIVKCDIGYPNDNRDVDNPKAESLKAAYSDAYKRAAVHWGIGRFLYGMSRRPGQRQTETKVRQSLDIEPGTRALVNQIWETLLQQNNGNAEATKIALNRLKEQFNQRDVPGDKIPTTVLQSMLKGIDTRPTTKSESEATTGLGDKEELIAQIRSICLKKHNNDTAAAATMIGKLKTDAGYPDKSGNDIPVKVLKKMIDAASAM